MHLTSSLGAIAASLDLAWDCRLTGRPNKVNERFAAFGDNFTIDGAPLNRNSFDWGLTFSTWVKGNWNLYIEGSGETGSQASSYNALLGLKFSW